MALKTKYSPLQHLSLDNLFTSLGDLSPRNKMVVLVIAGLGLVLVLFLPLSLVSRNINSLKKEVAAAQKGYVQVVDKIAEYEKVRREIGDLEKRVGTGEGSLSTRVEGVAKEAGMTVDQVREKAAQETDFLEINSIEVKLSNVSLSQLVEFLYNLESNKTSPIRLRRLQVKPKFSNRQLLDVSCDVATFVLKKEV